jgi:hypothetical protein
MDGLLDENGHIPTDKDCPWLKDCGMANPKCAASGRTGPYSCGMARAMNLVEKKRAARKEREARDG